VHIDAYGLTAKLNMWLPGSAVIGINGLTEESACAVLMTHHLIDNDWPLMMANNDQYIDTSIENYLSQIETRALDGLS